MRSITVISVFVLFMYVVPANLEKYDVIIIPVPMVGRSQPNYYDTNQRLRHKERGPHVKRNDYDRLDMENYEEPTVNADLDNFEYKDREDSDQNQDLLYGDDKIVGGVEVPINLYPYHVLYGSNCGGAIIDSKWILTAGHCGKKAYVRVGSKYLNEGAKYTIRKNYVHPGWSAEKKEHPFDFDFQLLELNDRLPLGDDIQPVKVAHLEDMVIGTVVTVTGWGNTEENVTPSFRNSDTITPATVMVEPPIIIPSYVQPIDMGPYSKVLRAVRVPIISKENCQGVPFPYFRGSLTSRMFCAGFAEGKKDACQGDSGGPAVANGRLLGMVSFGYGCATPGSYGVYSKVAKVRDWIEVTTGLTLD